MSFLEILAKKNIISESDLNTITEAVKSGENNVEVLLEAKGVSPESIVDAKSEYLGIPKKIVEDKAIPSEVLQYIPEESANHYKLVPLGVAEGILEVGLVDPDNIEARDALNFISEKINIPYKIFVISQKDFEKVLAMYKGLTGEVNRAITELESELTEEEEEIKKQRDESYKIAPGETKIIEEAPVTKIVATVLHYAVEANASDVHIESLKDKIRVRFRIDGVLQTSLVLPAKVHSAMVARIKILSNMKLDEKRKPQDGRFSARIADRKIDFRVSTFPAYYGEKVVMRILDQEKGVRPLDEMGLTPRNLAMIREGIDRPYGLILISGPTGSGKTTTLYAMLNEVDRETDNVLSLEDPIEYNIDGMNQSQVHPEIGYTFASGLRTTLRQDPDIIMVGEIRDKETAQLAVQAALTGHLVFSTIHTNNSMGVVPRLVDMGVDPYLIAPTLILAIAQRLVRKISPAGSGKPIESLRPTIKTIIEKEFEDLPSEFKSEIPEVSDVYEPVPSSECPTGLRGRIGVFEVFKMNTELQSVILKNPTEVEIMKVVRKNGLITMKEDAYIKALKGEIPFQEVNAL